LGNSFGIPISFVEVSCKDLNTGFIFFGYTRFLGFYIFKFLPQGHDYGLKAYPAGVFEKDIVIKDLGNYAIARFYLKETS
jgi:hypothetical protein